MKKVADEVNSRAIRLDETLREVAKIEKAIADARTRETDIGLEIASLLATADPNNGDEMQKIGNLRTQREVLPSVINRNEAALEEAIARLVKECELTERAIGAAADEELTPFLDRWEKVLKPIFPKNARTVAGNSPLLAVLPLSGRPGKKEIQKGWPRENAPAWYDSEWKQLASELMAIVTNWAANDYRFLAAS